MSSHLWPNIEIPTTNPLWFRTLQPAKEELSLTKLEEILEQQRRYYVEKGANLPFAGRTEVDNPDDDEDGDEAEEESEGGEPEDDMDVQPPTTSPTTATTTAVAQPES